MVGLGFVERMNEYLDTGKALANHRMIGEVIEMPTA